MKYAVITSGNKQFKVAEGDVIVVDHLGVKAQDAYTFPYVLMVVDGDARNVGTPYLENAVVSGAILGDVKGPKVRVAKFKAKARYRKVTGFRAQQTRVEIKKIEVKPVRQAQDKQKTK